MVGGQEAWPPEAEALLYFEVENYIQILAWFLEFPLLFCYNEKKIEAHVCLGVRGLGPPEAEALLHFEVPNYIQNLAWFLEFPLLSYNTIFKSEAPAWLESGAWPPKLKHCYILVRIGLSVCQYNFHTRMFMLGLSPPSPW